jgi:hypothetical protein
VPIPAAAPANVDSLIGPPEPRPPASVTNPRPPGAPGDTTRSHFEIVASPPDSSDAEAERVLAEASARRRERAAKPIVVKRFDAPRWVMLRSALLPGWGQLHNHAWLKAAGIAAGEIALGAQMWNDERELDRLSKLADRALEAQDEAAYDAATTAYNSRLTDENARRWFLGGVLAYALVDAYVDAHFANFNVEFDTEKGKHGKGSSAKLKVGWSF